MDTRRSPITRPMRHLTSYAGSSDGQRQRGPMERTPEPSTALHGFGGGRQF